MSADIILYRLSDVKVRPNGLYFIPMKEWNNIPENEYNVLADRANEDRFEDGQEHSIIDLTYYKWYYGKKRGWNRILDKFDRLPIQSGKVDSTGDIHKYIVADRVWWYSTFRALKNSWFKKPIWFNLCTTKEEVVKFFNRYGRKHFDEPNVIMRNVLEKWDEKSFLIISW